MVAVKYKTSTLLGIPPTSSLCLLYTIIYTVRFYGRTSSSTAPHPAGQEKEGSEQDSAGNLPVGQALSAANQRQKEQSC